MKRLAFLILGTLFAVTACGGPQAPQGPQLIGTYTGVVYSSGYAIGAMGIDVTTSNGELSGVGCFVALDYSQACNVVNGTIYGADAAFRIGSLRFSGPTNGSYIDTTFRSDDGTVSGSVYFTRDSTSAQALGVPSGDGAARALSGKLLGLISPAGR